MLLIIGLVLITYGYITFNYSDRIKSGNHRTRKNGRLPEWFPRLQKLSGLLLIIIGLLLSLTYFIL